MLLHKMTEGIPLPSPNQEGETNTQQFREESWKGIFKSPSKRESLTNVQIKYDVKYNTIAVMCMDG